MGAGTKATPNRSDVLVESEVTQRVSDQLRVMCTPRRLAILLLLESGPRRAIELVGAASGARHDDLNKLRAAGVISKRAKALELTDEGRTIFAAIRPLLPVG